jgi:plasmid stabilization system protein ParE
VSVARIVIEPLAKQDIREARDWYSEKAQGLSELFRDELIATFDFIAREPLGAAVAFGETRLKPMRRFPYVIGYICHDDVVHITGVRHGRQDLSAFAERDL